MYLTDASLSFNGVLYNLHGTDRKSCDWFTEVWKALTESRFDKQAFPSGSFIPQKHIHAACLRFEKKGWGKNHAYFVVKGGKKKDKVKLVN